MRRYLDPLAPYAFGLLALTFVAVAACSFSCNPGTAPAGSGSGGWFCCDPSGNCVWITSQKTQDCGPTNTVQWCEVVKTAADGTKSCSQWGDG
jgi:hypothetical protein